MAAPTAAEFREEFPPPEFAGVDEPTITRAIATARLLHSKRKDATLYLAAHILTLKTESEGSALDGGAGVVTADYIGSLRQEFVTQAGSSKQPSTSMGRPFYVQTRYGRMFLALEDRTPGARIAARVVG